MSDKTYFLSRNGKIQSTPYTRHVSCKTTDLIDELKTARAEAEHWRLKFDEQKMTAGGRAVVLGAVTVALGITEWIESGEDPFALIGAITDLREAA